MLMYDLIIRAARIVDGTGHAAFDGDLGIVGELPGGAPVELELIVEVR